MLVQLMYASRAAEPVRPEALTAIVRQSTVNNAKVGITGLLCFSDDVFLQVLEGGRTSVSVLYNRIARDPRHRDVVLLGFDEIGERAFAGWSMGQANLSRLNPSLLLKYSPTAVLDPCSVSARVSRALLADLVATASIVA